MSKLVEIKFTVDLDNPEQTQSLINVLADFANASNPKTAEAVSDTAEVEPKKEAPKKRTRKAPKKQEAETTEEPAAKPATSSATVEDVRRLVSIKAKDYRDALKAKLSELGANNVTTLKEEHYDDFLEFLNSLT